MPDILLTAIEYGGYISIVKLVIFLIMFFPWLYILGWVYEDAKTIGVKEVFWTATILGTGAATLIIWLVFPIFIVGLLLYIIAVGAVSVIYVIHRNSKVPDFDRVLTLEHLKGLFSNTQRKLEDLEDIGFITANNNEVPVPEPKTSDFFGFKTTYDIFKDAIFRRASNIVLSPTSENYTVIYIVDGTTLKQPSISKEQAEHFCRFLKHLADLDTNERRKPQKGNFRFRQGKDSSQWEVQTSGSTVGEQIKLKEIAKKSITKLSEINLRPEQLEQLDKIRDFKRGLFIISGPRQSGVTTTFYALLRTHDAFLNSISTLERQPTGNLPNIVQNVFSLSDSGTTSYDKKLLSIVRMGPNIVGVAEVNDPETAKIVLQAVKNGALVYATCSADSVINAIGKWIKLTGDKRIIAETLIGVSNQRLFRKLCPKCKQAYEPNKELLRKFNIPAEKAKVLYRTGKVVYDKRGKALPCDSCQETGYVGRTCVFETIMINDELREAMAQTQSLPELSKQFRREKMRYLQEQLLEKVLDRTTSINEMVRIFSSGKPARQKPKQNT